MQVGILSRKMNHRLAMWLFLIGVFSVTQIRLVGKLGISEFAMVVLAPFVFCRDYAVFRREGVLPILYLCLLWLVGAILADWIAGAPLAWGLKGWAVPITTFCTVVCLYSLLRKNISNYKWILLGIAISHIISIFVFQRGGAGDLEDNAEAINRVVEYKLFWTFMLSTWLLLPIQGWYYKTPNWYTLLVPFLLSLVNLKIGGRSAFLGPFVGFVILLFAHKRVQAMKAIKRNMLLIFIILGVVGLMAKKTYEYAVKEGYLGEAEMQKYEDQTKTGTGFLNLLMAGRSEFFVGLIAALDRPIIGHGTRPFDTNGYQIDFLAKYGDQEDLEQYVKRLRRQEGMPLIPSHSHVICYWLWHGIFGLLFWLYVVWLAFVTFARRLHVVPELFGYLAMTAISFAWNVLFSPFGLRVTECLFFVLCLLVAREKRYADFMRRVRI